MNAHWTHITVMMMLPVPTHMDHSTVPVILDSLAMGSIAQVHINEPETSTSVWVFLKSSWFLVVVFI